ncbi:MAG TPA: trehalose-phosphatase [Noviherbaspirillum sp.]
MCLLFFDYGAQRFDEVVRPGVLCAFDFDGTLAPIVTMPEKASLPAGIQRRLNELCSLTPTAVITGRSLPDIRERLGCEPTFVVGNHGLEGVPGWEGDAARHAQLCSEWGGVLAAVLQDHMRFDPGIRIENKTYSLSVHYRLARDHAKAQAQLAELFAGLLPGVRVMPGKCVFNLLPQDAVDKGVALERLIKACGAPGAVYVGDDVTDEDVFRRRQDNILTIRVGRDSASAAEFFVNHRLHVFDVLDSLISRLRFGGMAGT